MSLLLSPLMPTTPAITMMPSMPTTLFRARVSWRDLYWYRSLRLFSLDRALSLRLSRRVHADPRDVRLKRGSSVVTAVVMTSVMSGRPETQRGTRK